MRPLRAVAVRHVGRGVARVRVLACSDRVRGRERLRDGLVEPGELGGRVGVDVVEDRRREGLLRVRELDAVLRALGAGDRGDDRREVELEVLREDRLRVAVDRRVVPEALLLGVRLDERQLLLAAAGEAQVVHRHAVDREDRRRGSELRAHVADRGAVRERDRCDAFPVELDELADDAVLAQLLRDGEHHVGRGDARGDLARELEADDARDEHRDGLSEHGGLGLDATDAPAEHAEAVDHRRVRVGADARVGVGAQVTAHLARHDDAREVLDVHLVHDAGARRDDLEVVERRLAPAQELVALTVADVLEVDVALERVRAAGDVDLHGVVDDHLGGSQRVDPRGVATELGDGLTHGGEVDDARNTGEVLHDHAAWRELDLGVGLRCGVPTCDGADVVRGDVGTVLRAQEVLGEDLEAEREALGAWYC